VNVFRAATAPGKTGRLVPLFASALVCARLLFAPGVAAGPACPDGMAMIEGRFCIDRFESSLVELDDEGRVLRRHSPFLPVEKKRVRAVCRKEGFPQGYISMREAAAACREAGKRLCKDDEWITACQGKSGTAYPYGDEHVAGYCNDNGISPLRVLYPNASERSTFGWYRMNDPRLNQIPGSLAKSGTFSKCRNAYGVYDMIGNLHEWTADRSGTFRGGFYLDNTTHGIGCIYRATGHSPIYRDYSTGFRCCADTVGKGD
jgi:formylglycine-generating enzyme